MKKRGNGRHDVGQRRHGRIVWGSDWLVVLLGAGLLPWMEMTRALISGLSPDEQGAIAASNARRIYRV